MSLAQRVQDKLKQSMLAKNEARTSPLRMIRAELLKKEKEKAGTVLDDDTVLAVLQAMVKQRRDSIDQYRAGAREDLAAREEAEITVIAEFLPAAMTEDELRAEVDKAVAASGAATMKDIGKVMGALMRAVKASGKAADGQRLNALVKERLSS
ncbi:MAG: GatB/YqeY domain-containing protein [Candidatus Sumerlaeia bacterium]|nr:GatB/YqeY domain-containing protein [Candidatus Sumerlaeia bacterium]